MYNICESSRQVFSKEAAKLVYFHGFRLNLLVFCFQTFSTRLPSGEIDPDYLQPYQEISGFKRVLSGEC